MSSVSLLFKNKFHRSLKPPVLALIILSDEINSTHGSVCPCRVPGQQLGKQGSRGCAGVSSWLCPQRELGRVCLCSFSCWSLCSGLGLQTSVILFGWHWERLLLPLC